MLMMKSNNTPLIKRAVKAVFIGLVGLTTISGCKVANSEQLTNLSSFSKHTEIMSNKYRLMSIDDHKGDIADLYINSKSAFDNNPDHPSINQINAALDLLQTISSKAFMKGTIECLDVYQVRHHIREAQKSFYTSRRIDLSRAHFDKVVKFANLLPRNVDCDKNMAKQRNSNKVVGTFDYQYAKKARNVFEEGRLSLNDEIRRDQVKSGLSVFRKLANSLLKATADLDEVINAVTDRNVGANLKEACDRIKGLNFDMVAVEVSSASHSAKAVFRNVVSDVEDAHTNICSRAKNYK